MMKVVIADDEVRICKLIEALIDWNTFDMEVAGMAHNGVEACEMINKVRPDILITDIRMPGYSGLDLIERVKKTLPELEVVIISGYAHFEYAQQAIRFGVGYYLLKPISKAELEMNLMKIRDRISERNESREDRLEQILRAKRDDYHLQEKLVDDLLEKDKKIVSQEALRDVYHFRTVQGEYRTFCVKMDLKSGRLLNGQSVNILMEKVTEIFRSACKEREVNHILSVRGNTCIGVLNYPSGESENVRNLLKKGFNLTELQKDLFQPVDFTMASGSICAEPERLSESMQETMLLIQERILRGTGRIYEKIGKPAGLADSGILEKYIRATSHAVEIMEPGEASAAVWELRNEVLKQKGVKGYEVVNLVWEAANLYAAGNQMPERSLKLQELKKHCGSCSSEEELFQELEQFQQKHISQIREIHENDTVRPIRKGKQYIQNHFHEPITLEAVSEYVGLSPAYFSVLFKKTEGEGFAKYLINVRMEQAKILLRETHDPITEICKKVGYNDIKHFTHTFEKSTGVKPSIYRKLYG